MNPMRADIKRHTKNAGIGGTATTNSVAGLDQRKASVGGGYAPGCGNTRCASADNGNVDFT